MMPVSVLPGGGKAPIVIMVILGALAVVMLVNRQQTQAPNANTAR